jgi:hypothetical protein
MATCGRYSWNQSLTEASFVQFIQQSSGNEFLV